MSKEPMQESNIKFEIKKEREKENRSKENQIKYCKNIGDYQ